ncbi:MAG: DUF1963 domain-containing protein [Alphaproteobacteria bacterium]|jgi:uncharacterized protein YwqG|nr:DUF1963 domain-containing protein [Alphaproteobacteria bacterium]
MNSLQVLKDIYDSSKEFIAIVATPVERPKPTSLSVLSKNQNLDGLPIWASKFGGLPYLPASVEYPKNKDGEPMHLLAQINFIDMPYLEPFPRDGLLQFYIDTHHHLYGMRFDDEESSFKALYIPNQGSYLKSQNLGFLKETDEFPMNCVHELAFSKQKKPVSMDSPFFDKLYEIYDGQFIDGVEFYELYHTVVESNTNHKIGGYPCFTQQAPDFLLDDQYEVLLQIGYDTHISFGDAGIASFFILKEDLKNLDFSNVIFYWDCC